MDRGHHFYIVVRWDSRNALSSSNKVSISINGVHAFGLSSAWSVVDPQANLRVGSWGGPSYGADALIQGLTIYRRPLYEATTPSGINVGNGDEISQIYNSGTGKDPTLVTGSWDVVFALPTNQSAGALTTGTGNAWSHPHSSNLLYTSTTNTGGFMMGADYTTDGWSRGDGYEPTVGSLATANKIYAGGYYMTSTGASTMNIQRAYTTTAGSNYVLRAIGNSDGTCNPKIEIWNNNNGTKITELAGTTTSTRTAPDVYIFTWQAPSGNTSEIIKLLNLASTGTCSWHQVEVLENSITNPSMEGASSNPYIPTGWTNSNLVAGDTTQEATTVHSGLYSVKYTSSVLQADFRQFPTSSANNFYASGFASYGTFSGYTTYVPSNRAFLQNSYNVYARITIKQGATWQSNFGIWRVNTAMICRFFTETAP